MTQISNSGASDIYLTGQPQITFFKIVFRRHTNFAIETKEIPLKTTGSPVSNSSQVFELSTGGGSGHLLSNVYLKLDSTNAATKVYDLIQEVSFSIGGGVTDTITNDHNIIRMELETPDSKVNELRNKLTQLSGYYDNNSYNSIYYPVPFFFSKTPGVALPILALSNTDVNFTVKYGTAPNTCQLFGDFVFLSNEEQIRFAQVSHEYLIEQHQASAPIDANQQKIPINFDHAIKELFWVMTPSSSRNGNGCKFLPLNNANTNIISNNYIPKANDNSLKLTLSIDGSERFTAQDAKYFQTVQLEKHHTRVPGPSVRKQRDATITHLGGAAICGETTHAHILFPKLDKPIRVVSMQVFTQEQSTGSCTLTLYHGSTFVFGNEDNTEQMLSVTVSESFSDTTMNANTINVTEAVIDKDYSSIIPAGNTIGVKASTTLATWSGKFTMTYEELPTLIAGDGNNVCNIYGYSFSLKPEEFQPSGTLNMNRISKMELLVDNVNSGTKQFSPSSDAKIKVFAINYRILRISGGNATYG